MTGQTWSNPSMMGRNGEPYQMAQWNRLLQERKEGKATRPLLRRFLNSCTDPHVWDDVLDRGDPELDAMLADNPNLPQNRLDVIVGRNPGKYSTDGIISQCAAAYPKPMVLESFRQTVDELQTRLRRTDPSWHVACAAMTGVGQVTLRLRNRDGEGRVHLHGGEINWVQDASGRRLRRPDIGVEETVRFLHAATTTGHDVG